MEVEFNVATADWVNVPRDAGTARVLGGGITVLVDKTGLLHNALVALELLIEPKK